MTRGVWKGPFVHPSLLKKIDKLKDQTKKMPIKTWSRNSTIIPEFVGHSFLIHNGKSFIPITVSEEMVGHKLGEFSPTRKFSGHTPADKKAAAEGTSSPASGSAPKAAPGSSAKTAPAAAPASKPASPKKETK
jgi:small subunit ribosomal protein S19|tara:strand:- start:622 stop:1020 length:399 start_codon:yes stop_codon:yes gene_type:complete